MESTEDEQLERVNSLPDLELASTSSSPSSILTAEDSRSTTSSGEVSRTTTSSSGDIPALLGPVLVDRTLLTGEELKVAVAKSKCVGRNNKGVTWGFTSVIGRRREMEDAVAVIPGFMSRTCDHVGGCTAPGSRTSSEISPVHFFGVYDGHGGNQPTRVRHGVVHITGVYGEFRFQHRHVGLESVQIFGLSELGAAILVWHRVHGDWGDNATVTTRLCPVVTGAIMYQQHDLLGPP